MQRDLDIAREQAQRFRPRALAEAARPVLRQWGKILDRERGDVPRDLAAVLVLSAGGGSSTDPWPLGLAAAERLGVGPDATPHTRLWAGLRTVNEVGAQLHQHYGAVWPFPDEGFWHAVVQAHGLGLARWVSVFSSVVSEIEDPSEAEPADLVASWASRVPFEAVAEVAKAPPPLVAYRIGAAQRRIEAARILSGGARPVRSAGFGLLLERPDLRRRVTAARAIGGTHVVATAAMTAYHLGAKYAPKWFGL